MSGAFRRRLAAAALAAFAAALLCGAAALPAAAKSTVLAFSNQPSTTQAGGHPNILSDFSLGNRLNQGPMPECGCNDPKDVFIHAPAGVIANPHVVSECLAADAATFSCPADAQAGLVGLRLASSGGWILLPLYRMQPRPGEASLFVFIPPLNFAVPQYITFNARTGGDFGLDTEELGISHIVSFEEIAVMFWGVPGKPAHDLLRFPPGDAASGLGCPGDSVITTVFEDGVPDECHLSAPVHSSLPLAPFTQNPTTCAGPLVSTIDTVAYDLGTDHADAPWPATTGCDRLSFTPSLAAAPTTTEADAPSGLAVDLKVTQYQDPDTPSPSELRAAEVTLPEGFSINPGAADGKLSCSDQEANFGSEAPSNCPEFSKVGTARLDSSALPAPIDGYIYLGDPKPGDRYRIILTAEGFGTNVKIAGSVRPDPNTGQITAVFDDLPQAPFQEFDLHFFGSERGLLATPEQCGTYPVRTTFTPWAAELGDQTSTQFFTLDSGPDGRPCPNGPRPFAPSLQAGTADNTAGVHSPFALQLNRPDGDQSLTGLTVAVPPGFSATLKGIPYCPETAIAQLNDSSYSGLAEQLIPACPQASQIGTAEAAAGAGTHPLYTQGKVYLAGPYKGAPLSLEVVVPAVSGPYDLGVVAVRAALNVDPITAQVTTTSDPLPQILDGIPLRVRQVRVDLDRKDFALNPTNCDPFAVKASAFGDQGATANLSSHFQVANCADLGFAPKLAIRLKGGTKRNGHPALHATLTARAGDANISTTSVTLPSTEQLDSNHIGSTCTKAQFAANGCPANTVIGKATATSPLLDQPLKGTVYLVSAGNPLPDVVAALRGQLAIDLHGVVDTAKSGGLRTTFKTVPDVPVASFTLDLLGAKKGLIVNNTDTCKARKPAVARIAGQNGRNANQRVPLHPACGKARQKRHKHHKRHRRALPRAMRMGK